MATKPSTPALLRRYYAAPAIRAARVRASLAPPGRPSTIALPACAFAAALLLACLLAGRVTAEPTAEDSSEGAETSAMSAAESNGSSDVGVPWALESVTLTTGKTYRGLIDSEGEAAVDFIEVNRPRGKPMFLVMRHIDRHLIASSQRVSPEEKEALRARVQKYKNRSRIEAEQMGDLPLKAVLRDGTGFTQYAGQWFSLESMADESTTRRSIVRIEQIFAAYRQILPPRETPKRPLKIMLFGSTDQYREYLTGLELQIMNPAVYLLDSNVVVAGSNMNQFDVELAKVRRKHQAVEQELDALVADVPKQLKELKEQLTSSGVPAAERQKILVAEQKKWEEQRRNLRRRIAAADRANSARFEEVAGKMFKRLYHEAFHAYLENYVYPHEAYDVPRWLNEGLAQTFEGGILEADALRVDAPDRQKLAQLQADLRGTDALPLADLLTAEPTTFLAAHGDQSGRAAKLYLYSWGLAYYLVFVEPAFGTKACDDYVSLQEASQPGVERFEMLIGMPLPKFEQQWRRAMLDLQE